MEDTTASKYDPAGCEWRRHMRTTVMERSRRHRLYQMTVWDQPDNLWDAMEAHTSMGLHDAKGELKLIRRSNKANLTCGMFCTTTRPLKEKNCPFPWWVQWLRLRPPMQGTLLVWPPVRDLGPTCGMATMPEHHSQRRSPVPQWRPSAT